MTNRPLLGFTLTVLVSVLVAASLSASEVALADPFDEVAECTDLNVTDCVSPPGSHGNGACQYGELCVWKHANWVPTYRGDTAATSDPSYVNNLYFNTTSDYWHDDISSVDNSQNNCNVKMYVDVSYGGAVLQLFRSSSGLTPTLDNDLSDTQFSSGFNDKLDSHTSYSCLF